MSSESKVFLEQPNVMTLTLFFLSVFVFIQCKNKALCANGRTFERSIPYPHEIYSTEFAIAACFQLQPQQKKYNYAHLPK
ncbi:MAG: hypothetical protein RL164_1124 [Bacteroidota bacterium]